MSETRWTAGPYVCRIDECVKVRDKAGGLIAMLTHINHKGSRRDPDVVAYTGKLFAAAPDLYEALENTIDYLYQQITEGCKACFGDCANANPQSFCPMREMQKDYDQARTALAKARGEE